MEKKYITPSIKVIKLTHHSMLAASDLHKSEGSADPDEDMMSNHRNSSSIWGED